MIKRHGAPTGRDMTVIAGRRGSNMIRRFTLSR
jgi:hypothetical protein